MTLLSSHVDASVEGQIAVITTSQVFRNDLGFVSFVKYGFPLPEGASATELRWQIDGQWFQAAINPSPPDTTLPGSGSSVSDALSDYLGDTPLFFDLPQLVFPDSLLTVELTYTRFLPYSLGDVHFEYPSDYSLIQTAPLNEQSLAFNLSSPRTIDLLSVLSSHPVSVLTNNGQNAVVEISLNNAAADDNYSLVYTLASDELGLYGFSTLLDPSIVPDQASPGFFTFVVEPDANATIGVIEKVFTLILDRSGSMAWDDKIVQVKDACIGKDMAEGSQCHLEGVS